MRRLADKFANPHFASKLHSRGLLAWLVFSIPAAILLKDSIPFIVWVSLYAIVVSHWSSWQAVQTEIKQEKSDNTMLEILQKLKKLDPDDERVTREEQTRR